MLPEAAVSRGDAALKRTREPGVTRKLVSIKAPGLPASSLIRCEEADNPRQCDTPAGYALLVSESALADWHIIARSVRLGRYIG